MVVVKYLLSSSREYNSEYYQNRQVQSVQHALGQVDQKRGCARILLLGSVWIAYLDKITTLPVALLKI